MKQCPQCGAEYDDHVEFCFVDSTKLSPLRTSAATPLVPPPAIPPRRGSRVVPLVVMGLIFVVATPLVVVGVIFAVGFDQGASDDAIMAEPTPPARSNDVPAGGAAEPGPATVRIASIPPGAAVWEEDTQLCERTPCSIEQPDYGPAVRELRLVMAGYETKLARLEKREDELTVSMQTLPRPRPGPRPTAGVSPEPEPAGGSEPPPDPDPEPDGLIIER